MTDVAHLTPETIAAYRDGGLTLEERDRADDHLAQCPECIGLLAHTARTATAVERDAMALDNCTHCGDVINEHGCRCNGYEPEDADCQRCEGAGLVHDCQEDVCVCVDPITEPCPECAPKSHSRL